MKYLKAIMAGMYLGCSLHNVFFLCVNRKSKMVTITWYIFNI